MEKKKLEAYDVETNIINAIKHEKSLELFNIIGSSKGHAAVLDPPRNAYYRISKLIATGLVKRDAREYTLTTLGIIVYRGLLIAQKAVSVYWNLKAIDLIVSSGKIGERERVKVIKTMVDDQEIQRVILKTRNGV